MRKKNLCLANEGIIFCADMDSLPICVETFFSTLLAISIQSLIVQNLLFRLFIDGKSSLLTNESNKPEISGMPGKHWVRAPFTFRTAASVSCY